MKKLAAALLALLALPASAYAQTSITLPIAANAVADLGNGPLNVRVVQGNASIFTAQGSGVGSTPGSSTTLTLTTAPATAPIVGALISGTGITSGTTITAYDGNTSITLSAAMTVAASTPVAWGAACPSDASGIPAHYIQASILAGYYLMYTQARICAVSPGGPTANTLLILPILHDPISGSVPAYNVAAGSPSVPSSWLAIPPVQAGYVLTDNGPGVLASFQARGNGTVNSVSVVTANGISGSVANPTSTPAITLALGAITPSSVAIGAGSAITSSGPGGALGSNAFTSTAYLPLAGGTLTGGLSTNSQITSTLATGTAPFVIASTTRVANLNVATAGNADTVTTNANLTGPITSVGNATSIASQTGTGTKFVVDTSPSLVTPALGVATATSLAIGGATIGSNGLAVAGHLLLEGVTSTGATGTGALVFGTAPSVSSLTVTTAFTATGLVTLADHATQGANTFQANVTGGTASPTAATLPSCTGAAAALQYTNGTGLSCGTVTAAASSITAGTTIVNGGPGVLFNNSNGGTLVSSTTLPSGLSATSMSLTTPALGVATATSLAIGGATIGSNGLAVTGHLLLEGVTSTGATGTGNLAFSANTTFTGTTAVAVADASTGYRIGGAATSANYLRGNGTNFVSSAIQAGDLPLATNAAIGGMRGDTSTISCVAGVCSAVGAAATAITDLTTTITGGAGASVLTATTSGCSGTTPCLSHSNIANLLTAGSGIGVTGTTNATLALKTPYFQAYNSGSQSVTNDTATKLTLNTKTFDSNSWFDATTNYRYTPLLAGKYRFTIQVYGQVATALSRVTGILYKNGSSYSQNDFLFTAGTFSSVNFTTTVDMNGSTDYVEAYGRIAGTGGSNAIAGGNSPLVTFFEGAYVSP